LLLLVVVVVVVVQLVDVKDDLVRSLRRNRWDDEMAIVEEGKNGLVITTYSNRLCKSKDQGLLTVFIRGIWGGVKGLVPFSHERCQSSSSRSTTGRQTRRYSGLSCRENRRLRHFCYFPEQAVETVPNE
jgi:hypothetical protein